jgi:hypothetical protein
MATRLNLLIAIGLGALKGKGKRKKKILTHVITLECGPAPPTSPYAAARSYDSGFSFYLLPFSLQVEKV